MVEKKYLTAILLLAGLAFSSIAVAVDSADKLANGNPDNSKSKTNASLDLGLERAAIDLVTNQLPELAPVIQQLRKSHPDQYNNAIRDLARSARRLEAAKNRGEEIYEIEAALLKAQTHARLLTAKLKVRDRDSDRKELRAAVEAMVAIELELVQHEIRVTKQKIEKAKQQLSGAEERLAEKQNHLDEHLEKTYLNFLRKAGRNSEK